MDDRSDEKEAIQSPLLGSKVYDESSVFTPASLLRQARRQKDLTDASVPTVCLLDPDGDIVDHLVGTGTAQLDSNWPGYHTDLYRFSWDGIEFGIVGRAVGAPFATLVAEQLFASGCQLLLSMTSAGRITPLHDPPYFVVIERALRDEGTSHHYRSPGRWATIDSDLLATTTSAETVSTQPVHTGASWTTDAPFRETPSAIERAESAGVLAVEMEAAALYTFAWFRDVPVICFAHVTNRMGQAEEDFEKGANSGVTAALDLLSATANGWLS